MTASELAFLALGLLLGAATGAALIVILGSRSPRRAIRVTVTRDALPRRSETLSQDAFVTSSAEPAPGGPGDRRWFDRGPIRQDRAGNRAAAAMAAPPLSTRSVGTPIVPAVHPMDRTPVPSSRAGVGIAIRPDADAELGVPGSTPAPGAALERMLRGDHRAMVEVVDRIAGQDSARRRDWELLLGGLVEALATMAVRESVIDFPMGTALWDTFTIEQCRRIVGALGSMGYYYDGRTDWVGQRVPTYRELAQALADIGVEPRRVRHWPNQVEIAALFVGARPAPEELLAAAGPEYTAEDMQALIGDRALDLTNLWLAWDAVRPVLFEDAGTGGHRPSGVETSDA